MTFFERMIGNLTLVEELEFLLRIVISCVCGALIGLERSRRFKEAGIRTHILVACASALMMVVSKYGFADMTIDGEFFSGTRGADTARIAAQVVSGISFLGAGVIFKNGSSVKGLTTAAGIWATAGIGIAIGAGLYLEGIFVTVLIMFLQYIMHKITVGKDAYDSFAFSATVKDTELFHAEFDKLLTQYDASASYGGIVKNRDETTTLFFNLSFRKKNSDCVNELMSYAENDQNIITFKSTPNS